MSIYLTFPGVPGNTSAKGFEECITLTSFDFGVTRPVSMDAGSLANRAASTPNLACIQVSKQTDMSSPMLFKESVTGSDGKEVKIHFVRTKDKIVQEYLTYILTGCVVSGYTISGNDGDAPPEETIELSYTAIEAAHTDYKADDTVGTVCRCCYDIALAEVS